MKIEYLKKTRLSLTDKILSFPPDKRIDFSENDDLKDTRFPGGNALLIISPLETTQKINSKENENISVFTATKAMTHVIPGVEIRFFI